jgi:hypothetical protein
MKYVCTYVATYSIAVLFLKKHRLNYVYKKYFSIACCIFNSIVDIRNILCILRDTLHTALFGSLRVYSDEYHHITRRLSMRETTRMQHTQYNE